MKFLVIGEICKDVFVYGECPKLSPEAPVPVFIPKMKKSNKGMAGNVVRNLKSIDKTFEVEIIHQKDEIVKTRYVEYKSNHMFIRVDEEDIVDRIQLTDELIEKIKQSDVVIVSDYDKGFLKLEDIQRIGKESKINILDSKKILDENTIDSFCFVKLNLNEYERNIKHKDKQNIIVTLGSKGCMYQDEIFDSPAPRETIDVSGAGDTFTASFISKYNETLDIFQSIKFANEMASIVVSKRGVSTPF